MDRLNFSSSALIVIRELSDTFKDVYPQSSSVLKEVCSLLESSEKFILPPYGELLDRGTRRQEHMDLFHLPFPVTAFEYTVPTARNPNELKDISGLPQEVSTRRISLCWSHDASFQYEGFTKLLDRYPDGGVFFTSLYTQGDSHTWHCSDGFGFVAKDAAVSSLDSSTRGSHSGAYRFLLDAGRAKPNWKGVSWYARPLLPEFFSHRANIRGQADAFGDLQLDLMDECGAMLDACIVLNCDNADTEIIPAPQKLNRKRATTGKPPLFDYRVLVLKPGSGQPPGDSHGGTHRSPRTHVRRAHLRRLKDRTVLVRSALVNPDNAKGYVSKDYEIR